MAPNAPPTQALAWGRVPAFGMAVALALLAGCASPAGQPAPAQAAASTTILPPAWLDWGQVTCESMTWQVPVLASSLQPYMPAGFQPSEPAAAGAEAPVGLGQAATLGFRAVECNEGFGTGDLLGSIQSGYLFTPVLPPAELREERFGTRYAFGWDVLVAEDAWRADADAWGWGLPLHDGGALVGPTAQGWTAGLAMDQVGAFTVTGRTFDSPARAADEETRLITLGSRGFALWDGAVEGRQVSTGVGVWNASPESWVATVLGATQGAATFELATWSMPRAQVHWPGAALGPVEPAAGYLGGMIPLPLSTVH